MDPPSSVKSVYNSLIKRLIRIVLADLKVVLWKRLWHYYLSPISQVCPPTGCQVLCYFRPFGGKIIEHKDMDPLMAVDTSTNSQIEKLAKENTTKGVRAISSYFKLVLCQGTGTQQDATHRYAARVFPRGYLTEVLD